MQGTAQRLIDKIKLWREDERKNAVNMLLNASNLMFFFTYKDEVFGGNESSRVMYAKMLDEDDEDHTPGWMKEANFGALNLTRTVKGEKSQTVFGEKDIPDIKVVTDKAKVEKLLA